MASVQSSTEYHSQGLSRGLAVLRLLGAAGQPVAFAAIADELGLPKGTLVRLLAVLERESFVRRVGDPPEYSVGQAIGEIAEGYRPPDVAEIAAPVLKRLADEVGFTANLGAIEGRAVLHLSVAEPERALRYALEGMLDGTYCTGLGKMLLSTLPAAMVSAHVPEEQPYASFTAATFTTRAALDEELSRIRKVGYSIDDEERNRGVRCIAILVPTREQFPLALSVSAPAAELTPRDQKRLLPVLRAYAAELTALPLFTSALHSLRTRLDIR